MSGGEQMTTTAQERVAVLEARINGHEELCAKRYGDLERSMNRLNGMALKGTIAILAAQGGLIAWLITHNKPLMQFFN